MTANDRDKLVPSQAPNQGRQQRCPKCAGVQQRLNLSFLDPTCGKTVSLYECHQCGERIWHD